ncbi:Uncharacterised protein [Chryseobacterium taklimakanense]|uniref:Uncharacterized protein n=1 Tax=Chryseobacterium taklimakanense TaxID=536441 RepID=A0A239X2R5_9FLAO|nr:hypothetical protein [Chryseobacterium taklimakanense]SNV40829.1 Uncharacterised protein [Chryseobacterium taklimakanense]
MKLNDTQKNRLKKLKPQFENAIREKNFTNALVIFKDIQELLLQNNNKTLLARYKNWIYELALDVEEYSFAERGLIGVRKDVKFNTRLYLEATALLAICYLRILKVENAKPLIKEVLNNSEVIKTERTRKIFNKEIIQRFDEEIALFSLKEKNAKQFGVEEIETDIGFLVATKTESELFGMLGKSVPLNTKNLLYEVDSFAKNQLPYTERKLLQTSDELMKDEEAGKTVFKSFKRTIYNSICDQKSQVYKMWNEKIVGAVFDIKYLIGAITLALNNASIGIKALIVTAAAIVIRFGLDVYCEHYKPKGLMETRKE